MGASTSVSLIIDGTTPVGGSGSFSWGTTDRYLGIGALLRGGAYPTRSEAAMWFNDLSLTSVVPEPSTLTILVSAMVGLLAYAWRKRK